MPRNTHGVKAVQFGSPTRTVLTPDSTRKTPTFIFPSIAHNAPVFEDRFGFQVVSGGRQGLRLSLESAHKPSSMTAKASQAATGEDVYTFRKATRGSNGGRMVRRAVAA